MQPFNWGIHNTVVFLKKRYLSFQATKYIVKEKQKIEPVQGIKLEQHIDSFNWQHTSFNKNLN